MNSINTRFNPGLDTSVLKQVSQEILKRAAEKTGAATSFTAAKPADMGIDLYKGSVNSATARQIAMNNAGFQVQLNQNVLSSIKFLNSQAAQNTHKTADGKITVAAAEAHSENKPEQAPQFNKLLSLAAGKDKNSSSQQYHGEILKFAKKEKQEETNIFS